MDKATAKRFGPKRNSAPNDYPEGMFQLYRAEQFIGAHVSPSIAMEVAELLSEGDGDLLMNFRLTQDFQHQAAWRVCVEDDQHFWHPERLEFPDDQSEYHLSVVVSGSETELGHYGNYEDMMAAVRTIQRITHVSSNSILIMFRCYVGEETEVVFDWINQEWKLIT